MKGGAWSPSLASQLSFPLPHTRLSEGCIKIRCRCINSHIQSFHLPGRCLVSQASVSKGPFGDNSVQCGRGASKAVMMTVTRTTVARTTVATFFLDVCWASHPCSSQTLTHSGLPRGCGRDPCPPGNQGSASVIRPSLFSLLGPLLYRRHLLRALPSSSLSVCSGCCNKVP